LPGERFLKKSGSVLLFCYDFDNIRYITGTHIGEWNRNTDESPLPAD
jgi:hypothetical protein